MQIASPFGIPLRVHWSFSVLVAGFAAWATWMGGWTALVAVTMASAGLFVSVVLHELGHAMAARRFGIDTHHITMYPFGGVAAIEEMPEDPHQEMVIAIAGPAVNFVLGAAFGWLYLAHGHPLLAAMVMVNLGMGLFNLLPAYPMDGGRVLRALLAMRMGWLPASKLAVRIGRVFAWAFVVGGVALQYPSLLLVGVFLHVALNAEKRRLVWINYQRTTGNTPPWDPSVRYGSGLARPR